jgi:hypothetical protein
MSQRKGVYWNMKEYSRTYEMVAETLSHKIRKFLNIWMENQPQEKNAFQYAAYLRKGKKNFFSLTKIAGKGS